MAKEELGILVQKEHDLLMAEKKEALEKVAEIDKKLEPVLAYLNAGKKVSKTGEKRGRKSKTVIEPQTEA